MSIQHVYNDDQYTQIVIALDRIKAQVDIFQMFVERGGTNDELYDYTLVNWAGSVIRDLDAAKDVLTQANEGGAS